MDELAGFFGVVLRVFAAAAREHHEGWIPRDRIEKTVGRQIHDAARTDVEIQPIGRGTTSAVSGSCGSPPLPFRGSYCIDRPSRCSLMSERDVQAQVTSGGEPGKGDVSGGQESWRENSTGGSRSLPVAARESARRRCGASRAKGPR